MKLFGTSFHMIEKKLDLTLKRHAILASNVANSQTPGYRARELDFAGELQKILNKNDNDLIKTHPLHMGSTTNQGSHVVFDDSGAVGSDGNNVDLDIVMGKLGANARTYTSAATLMSMQLRILRKAARGGQGGI